MFLFIWLTVFLVEIGRIRSFQNETFIENITNLTTFSPFNTSEHLENEGYDGNVTVMDIDEYSFSGTNTTALNLENNPTAVDANFIGKFFKPDRMEQQTQITNHLRKIFCEIKTIFLYVYVELRVDAEWSYEIIKMLSDCAYGGVVIVRYM